MPDFCVGFTQFSGPLSRVTEVIRFNYCQLHAYGMSEVPAPTHYDSLLAAMPASVAGGAAVGWILAIPVLAGMAVGGVLAGLMLAVSLFVMPPK